MTHFYLLITEFLLLLKIILANTYIGLTMCKALKP